MNQSILFKIELPGHLPEYYCSGKAVQSTLGPSNQYFIDIIRQAPGYGNRPAASRQPTPLTRAPDDLKHHPLPTLRRPTATSLRISRLQIRPSSSQRSVDRKSLAAHRKPERSA